MNEKEMYEGLLSDESLIMLREEVLLEQELGAAFLDAECFRTAVR